MKREWFQQPKKPLMKYAHYDLTTQRKRNLALFSGAKVVGREILTEAWWAKGDKIEQVK